MKLETDRYGDKWLVLDDDIRVSILTYEDGRPFIQINTSSDTESWKNLEVYMNDGKAVQWR